MVDRPLRSWWALPLLALWLLVPERAPADVVEAFVPPGDEAAAGIEAEVELVDDGPGRPFESIVRLTAPPLLRVPPGEVMDWSTEFDRKYRFRMNMAYGAAGVTAAGVLPFAVAVALHEIWPCGGRDCIRLTTVMGLSGLGGLSLFLIGAGAMAHWSTVAAHALFDPKAPFRAIWMGRVSFFLWSVSEVLLTLAIIGPGAGLFWAGILFGFASIPFAIGQLVSTTLRRRDRVPGTPVAGWRAETLPIAQWSLSP